MSDYTSWYVGMKVECIVDSVGRVNDLGFPGFKKGQRFTVAEVRLVAPLGLFLGFVERHPMNLGHVDGFRPIVSRKTDISIFHSILNGHRISEDA